jgi:hypothetical protein
MPRRGTTDDENRPFSRESAMALRATTGNENGRPKGLFSGQSAMALRATTNDENGGREWGPWR